MATKHDVLTEDELSGWSVAPNVLSELMTVQEAFGLSTGEINVLDWGCGRGRSVARFREMGFNAYGVEIDRKTMGNGFELFQNRGLNASTVLRHISDMGSFSDGFFHFVFSEQVFEHVEDLEAVAHEMARVTSTDGIGVHNFPSARCILEEHLFMPFVHWLPKRRLRSAVIRLMVSLGMGPKPDWPEILGESAAVRARFYFDYTVRHTYYRDIRTIVDTFTTAGFDVTVRVAEIASPWKRLLTPNYLYRNGFPNRHTSLLVRCTDPSESGEPQVDGEPPAASTE